MLYQIFCITNPSFVALIMKMFKHQLETNRAGFSIIGSESKNNSYRKDHLCRSEQVLEPLSALMHSVGSPGYGFDTTRRSEFTHPRAKHETVNLLESIEKNPHL